MISHLSFAIEAQDFKADTGGPSCLDLVEVSKKVEPCSAPAIIQLPLRKHT